ncbi:MAG: trimeric autotransporter adhesin [Thermoleophilaceae bacterium]|jgi:hypothetical protein|nr:trimeric autotransporter adhesin [Thermoleophilaceae bacterium]
MGIPRPGIRGGLLPAAIAVIVTLVAAPGAHAAAPGTKTVAVAVTDVIGTNPTAAGWGRVTSQPAGIDCPTDCSEDFAHGSTVSLTVTPTPGYVLRDWEVSGNDSGCEAALVCTLTIGAGDAAVVAAAMSPQASLALTPHGAGVMTVAPAEAGQPAVPCTSTDRTACVPRYPKGARVTVTATPDATVPGARFVRWSDYRCPPTGRTCTLTMDGEQFLTAVFAPVFLTVLPGTFGPVTVSPPGVACTFAPDPATGTASPCRVPYALDVLATVTRNPAVLPDPGDGWIGACFGSEVACQVRMRSDQTVIAGSPPQGGGPGTGQSMRFGYAGSKGGRITVTGAGSVRTCRKTCVLGGFQPDSRIQIRASGSKTVTFAKWSDIKVKQASRSIYVGDPTAVQATFKKKR